MRRTYAVAALLVATAVAGCQQFLTIRVVNDHTLRPVFQFHYATGSTPLTVDVRGFAVSTNLPGGDGKIVWEIRSKASYIAPPNGAVTFPDSLKQIEYGAAPEGFETVVAPEPLRWEQPYQVAAFIDLEEDRNIHHAGGKVTLTQLHP